MQELRYLKNGHFNYFGNVNMCFLLSLEVYASRIIRPAKSTLIQYSNYRALEATLVVSSFCAPGTTEKDICNAQALTIRNVFVIVLVEHLRVAPLRRYNVIFDVQ